MVEYVARQVGEDGRYTGQQDTYDCRDDGHAVLGVRDVAIWCGDRFVFKLECKSRSGGRAERRDRSGDDCRAPDPRARDGRPVS